MRIGLDVMGGDNAPKAILEGALASLDQLSADDQLVLVGLPDVIEAAVAEHGAKDDRICIVPATEVIAMDESPVEAVRAKKDSSIAVLAAIAGPKADDRGKGRLTGSRRSRARSGRPRPNRRRSGSLRTAARTDCPPGNHRTISDCRSGAGR